MAVDGGVAMGVDDVCAWLAHIGCEAAVDAFRSHSIDGQVLLTLSDATLKDELRIESLGIRTKILLERANAHAQRAGLHLQLEPAEDPPTAAASAAAAAPGGAAAAAAPPSREKKHRPAEIDVFSPPSPRLPTTPQHPGSAGSGTTNVSLSPAQSVSSGGSLSESSASSNATTLAEGSGGSSGSLAASEVSQPSPVPRSPAFVMSPKLAGMLAPEQIQLRKAVEAGDAAGAQAILERVTHESRRREWANTADEHGFTLLMEGVALEKLPESAAVCRVLLSHGADASASDEDDYTALHWAAACDNEVAVALLVSEAKMAVDCRCGQDETALHRAARMGNVDATQVRQFP